MGIFRKTILYFLSDKNNQTYAIEGDAIVKTDKPKPLEDNPIGADGLQIAFGTNNKYWSLNRSFTVPLTFVNEGADILRYLVYKGKGYEEEVTLTILKLNPDNGVYELEFQGKIDFTKLKDDPTTGVTVNVIEGGLLSYLNANEGIDYEIQCNATNPECVIVQFDGVLLNDAYKYETYPDPFTSLIQTATYFQDGLHRIETPYITVPLVYLSNEGDSVGVGSGKQQPETFKDETYFDTSANTILENFAGTPINIHLKGAYPFSISDDNRSTNEEGLFEAIVFIKPDNLPVQQFPITSFNIFWNRSYEVNIDTTISMPGNSKLFLVFKFPTEYQNVNTFNLDNTRFLSFQVTFGTKQNIYIYLETKNTPSTSYALEPLQLGRELVRLMTDGRYTMESDFFTTHNNVVAAGGEAIRGLTNAVLKTSFQDFFNSYNALYNLKAQVIDNVLRIEQKGYVFGNDTLDIGEVSDFAIGYAEEYLVNSVQIGYPVQDYDERNGRYEFNDTVQWKLPVNAVNKPLDLVSKYRGDSYGIEFNRGKLNNKDSTDNKGDNEVFLININTYGVTGEVFLLAIKNPVNNYSGLITFDSETVQGGAENFIATIAYEYVYHYASPQQVEFNFSASGTRTTDKATFTIYLNGAAAASHTVDSLPVFNVSLSIGPTLKNGDIVHIGIDNPVNLTSASLQAKVLNAIPLTTFFLRRLTYDTLTGVPTNSVYNVEEMTPKRMLLAHGNYLRSLLFQLPAEKITFQTADKNKDLSTTLNGVTITEKADVTVSELSEPLFLPFEFTLTTRVQYAFSKIMSKLTAQTIKFTYNNFPIYALPIGDMKCKPVTDEAQEWKLLASPLNSLDTLLKLSAGAVIIQDYMKNQIIISDLNPVHFVRYDCVQTPDHTYIEAAIPPTGNQGLVAGVQNASWNSNGAKIYAPGFQLNGLGTVVAHLTTPHFWVNGVEATEVNYGSPTRNLQDGRMNQNGIWVQGNVTPGTTWMPVNEWIGFSRKVTVSTGKTIYLGISGDSWIRLKVNGIEIINTIGSNLFVPSTGINCLTWSIYPVNLSAGDNFIEMSVMNGGAPFVDNPAGFACEMYDMNLYDIVQATSEADLNIIFRTKDMIGQPFDIGTTIGYSCKEGWVLEKDEATGDYSCVKTVKGNDCTGDHTLNKRYHFKGIYDDRFEARLDRYDSKAKYYQKWQTNDFINLQFITVGYGALQLEIYDCQTNQISIIKATVKEDTSLQKPYIKQEYSIDLSQFNSGVYQFVISINNVKLLVSEWQQLATDYPETLLIEYYNTINKPDAYFKTWRPCLRIEAFIPPPTPESVSTTYEDEPGDTEILNGTGWMKQKFILGDGYGLPDYMAKKLNRLLLLNRVYMDGVEYTKAGDAKLETVELVQGYPMNYFTVDMRESINSGGLIVSDMDLGNEFISTLTLDAGAFGSGEGVIQIEETD